MKLPPPRGYVCGCTTQPPAFDGRLTEGACRDAPWTEEFTENDPLDTDRGWIVEPALP